jgi:hypothetical protein
MAVVSVSGILHYAGLSTDTKPTSGVPPGSRFIEITLGSPNVAALWFFDGAEWGLMDGAADLGVVVSGVTDALLIPQVATGEIVIDESEADWTSAQDIISIAPATGFPLNDARLDIDLAKATTGFAAGYTAQTLTLQVWRKTDGTNWRGEAAQTAISGTNAASRVFPLALGVVGVADKVKVTAKLSAEKDGSTVSHLPFRLHYLAGAAPTITPAT